MKRTTVNKVAILFLSSITAVGCSEGESKHIESNKGDVKSSIAANDQSAEELKEELAEIQKAEEKRLEIEHSNSTTLEFDKLKHDFGDVMPESSNTTEFTVTNTGDKPLIISDVSASCGCTTPMKPEGPIAPGESDVIMVTFKSKPGQVNEIKKTVTVTANTMSKVHMLEIRAFVKE